MREIFRVLLHFDGLLIYLRMKKKIIAKTTEFFYEIFHIVFYQNNNFNQ